MKEEMPVVIRILDVVFQMAWFLFLILSAWILISVFRGKIFEIGDTAYLFGLAITIISILSLDIIKYKRIIRKFEKQSSKRKIK